MELAAPLQPLLKFRLSVMMFLQYAIWGAWLPILYPFLMGYRKFTLDETGYVLAAGAAGAIFGPFIAGELADRKFATEKLLALSHFLGAVLVWFLADTESFAPFVLLSALYGLIYAPTLALTNSLAFAHLPNRDKDFGPVRLWGTIGWICAGILVGQLLLRVYTPDVATHSQEEVAAAQDAGRAVAFKISAIVGLFMACYCMTLPSTPPSPRPKSAFAVGEALGEIAMQPLITLFLIAIPVSMIHQFYFVHTSGFLSKLQLSGDADKFVAGVNSVLGVGGGGLMTIGQMTEIAVLASMPLLTQLMSRKALLITGLLAYAARMALFAYCGDSVPLVMLGVALHGVCFGCFVFVAFMVVDEQTSPDVRATAQNLFNLVIIGVGIIVGSWFATSVVADWAMVPGADGTPAMDYTRLFSIPMWMALGCVTIMLWAYPTKPGALSRQGRGL